MELIYANGLILEIHSFVACSAILPRIYAAGYAYVFGLNGKSVSLFLSSFKCFSRFDAEIFIAHTDNENRFINRIKEMVSNHYFFGWGDFFTQVVD